MTAGPNAFGSSAMLVAPWRTPIGNAGHGFAALTTTDLAAPVLAATLATLRESGCDSGPAAIRHGYRRCAPDWAPKSPV